eukprot:s278_g3.t1
MTGTQVSLFRDWPLIWPLSPFVEIGGTAGGQHCSGRISRCCKVSQCLSAARATSSSIALWPKARYCSYQHFEALFEDMEDCNRSSANFVELLEEQVSAPGAPTLWLGWGLRP